VACSGAEERGPADSPDQPLATVQQTVGLGDFDTTNQFPFVVALSNANGGLNGAFCSGTIVSPVRVLSASHCFWNRGGTQANVDIHVLTHSPTGAEIVRTIPHRATVSGPITLFSNGPNNSDQDRASDMAIVPLDTPFFDPAIPFPPVANPVSPCPSSFTGTMVGFGPVLGPWPGCGIIDDSRRNFRTSGPWSFEDFTSTGLYSQSWIFSNYEGSMPGDSGGGLFFNGTLCGITVGHSQPDCYPFTVSTAWSAAVQGGSLVLGSISAEVSWTDPVSGESALVGMCPASYLGGAPPSEATVKDTDLDGVPDLCDTCPTVKNKGQMTGIEPDSDGDGVPNACDKCPGKPDVDSDGDGVLDCFDPCPCSPASQTDPDDDGVCNTCDPTLMDLDAKIPVNTCGQHCTKQVIDNCPTVKNTNQKNCNADAERARAALALGDVCDPVPCPLFEATREAELISSKNKVKTYNKGFVFIENFEEILRPKEINLTPIGSHGSSESPLTGQEVTTPVSGTPYRFCFEALPFARCTDDSSIDDEFLLFTSTREEEQVDSVWHRISLNGLAVGENEPAKVYFQKETVASRNWNWEADFSYWNGRWPQSVQVPSAPGDGKGSRFWLNGRTAVGMADLSLKTGFHGQKQAPQSPAFGLANHYQGFTTIELKETSTFKHQTLIQEDLSLLIYPCLTCAVSSAPSVDDCPQCGPVRQGPDYDDSMVQIVTRFPGLPESTGVKLRDGRIQKIDPSFSAKVRELVEDEQSRVVNQVEPSTTIGQASAFPAVVVLSKEGTTLKDTFTLQGRTLVADSEACGRLCEVAAPAGAGAIVAQSATNAEATGPSPRENYQAVYSRATGSIFVVGGTVPGTNQPTQEIWRGSTEGSWAKMDLKNYKPQKVLSATYSFKDGKLWVLDSFKLGLEWARLTRIDPATGESEILGTWPKFGLYDRHWLLVDRDGSILLTASSQKLNKHTVLRLESTGSGVQVRLARLGSKALAFSPVVDASGYWFASAATKKQPVSKMERVESLDNKSGKWTLLAECL
jgi:hypothetical protein